MCIIFWCCRWAIKSSLILSFSSEYAYLFQKIYSISYLSNEPKCDRSFIGLIFHRDFVDPEAAWTETIAHFEEAKSGRLFSIFLSLLPLRNKRYPYWMLPTSVCMILLCLGLHMKYWSLCLLFPDAQYIALSISIAIHVHPSGGLAWLFRTFMGTWSLKNRRCLSSILSSCFPLTVRMKFWNSAE